VKGFDAKRMSKGLTLSIVAHAGFLGWSIITLVAKPFDKMPEAAPVDIVSADEFSKMTKGQKDQKKPEPKPLVEKVGDPKTADEPVKKVSEKKEIAPTASEPPPPAPETKPEKKPEKAEDKPDPIAEALKKEEAKKPDKPKKAEAKPQTNPLKHAPKFDVKRIAALLDRRDPQRQERTGAVANPNGGLGAPTGESDTLSQSELDALRTRLSQCWNPPVGALEAQRLFVVLRVVFNPDGTVAKPPEMVEATPSPVGPAMVESAKRAILQCQPFTMLRKETYSTWKDLELKFDPRDMFRG
jgi:colicin import membrane protein